MNAIVQTEGKTQTPLDRFRGQFESRRAEIAGALPAHIPYERYARVIMNAVAQNPDLLAADRASLLISVAKAATDGLLCDGREAALVIFGAKVSYMPMLAGILKKCRNSGELASIVARVVYAGDKFRNWIDDTGEHLEYEAGNEQDRDVVRCAFAMAKLKDGSIEVEVLRPADIEKIRSVSRAKNKGPWVDWWEEMAKKSAIRRLSKRLPLNTDLDDLIRQDDQLYAFEGASDKQHREPRAALSMDQRLDMLASGTPARPAIESDPETGEIAAEAPEVDYVEASTHGRLNGAPDRDNAGQGSETRPASEPAQRPAAADRQPERTAAPRTVVTSGQQPTAAAPGPRALKVGDDPARDEATRTDLLEEAERRAADSVQSFEEFEGGLNDYEFALLERQLNALRRKAKNGGAT